MIGGQSSSVGVVLYDTDKTGCNAVFCSFKDGHSVVEAGEKDSLIKKMTALDNKNKYEKNDPFYKFMLIVFIALAVFIAAIWIFIGGFFPVLGAVIFSAIGYIPILSFVSSARKSYLNEEDFHRFRRFHGAEHMAVNYLSDEKRELDFSAIKKESIYHNECGSVYFSSLLVFSAVFGTAFGFIPEIGFWKFILIAVISALILFLNLFNPLNPLKYSQHNLVEKPEEKEIFLIYGGAKILKNMN